MADFGPQGWQQLIVRTNARGEQNAPFSTQPTQVLAPFGVSTPSVSNANVSFAPGIGAKAYQAWKYRDGNIQRAPKLHLDPNNPTKEYFDPIDEQAKSQKLPRRKQETNLFVTLNLNKIVPWSDELRVNEALMKTINKIQTSALSEVLVCGPARVRNADYFRDDNLAVVLKDIKFTTTIEQGPRTGFKHVHMTVSMEHYSQIQMDKTLLRTKFIELYNDALVSNVGPTGRPGRPRRDKMALRGLYVDVKLRNQMSWHEIEKWYLHKDQVTL